MSDLCIEAWSFCVPRIELVPLCAPPASQTGTDCGEAPVIGASPRLGTSSL